MLSNKILHKLWKNSFFGEGGQGKRKREDSKIRKKINALKIFFFLTGKKRGGKKINPRVLKALSSTLPYPLTFTLPLEKILYQGEGKKGKRHAYKKKNNQTFWFYKNLFESTRFHKNLNFKKEKIFENLRAGKNPEDK